jgi:uncharacterized membrane protein
MTTIRVCRRAEVCDCSWPVVVAFVVGLIVAGVAVSSVYFIMIADFWRNT